VSVVYPITAAAPIVTLVCSYVLFRSGEHLTWRVTLGILAVVLGVAVLTTR
jgi:drug/metabolite transporter (DMT)-like permease